MMSDRWRWIATTYQRMVFVDFGWQQTMLFWNTPKFGYPLNSSRFVLLRTTSKCPHSYYHRLYRKIHQGTCSCGRRCRRFTAKCARRRRSDRRRSSSTLFNAHTPHSVFWTNHCAVLELQVRHIIVCLQLQCFLIWITLDLLPCFYVFFSRLLINTGF